VGKVPSQLDCRPRHPALDLDNLRGLAGVQQEQRGEGVSTDGVRLLSRVLGKEPLSRHTKKSRENKNRRQECPKS
jgi:hypothetical protein